MTTVGSASHIDSLAANWLDCLDAGVSPAYCARQLRELYPHILSAWLLDRRIARQGVPWLPERDAAAAVAISGRAARLRAVAALEARYRPSLPGARWRGAGYECDCSNCCGSATAYAEYAAGAWSWRCVDCGADGVVPARQSVRFAA